MAKLQVAVLDKSYKQLQDFQCETLADKNGVYVFNGEGFMVSLPSNDFVFIVKAITEQPVQQTGEQVDE